MAQKVSTQEIDRLKNQKFEKNEFVDGVDGFDRATGRILSSLGKFISKSF